MLDELSLADKLQIAAVWFRRADEGRLPFTRRTAQRFSELLGQCVQEAVMLEIERASRALVEGRSAAALGAQLTGGGAAPDGRETLMEGKP